MAKFDIYINEKYRDDMSYQELRMMQSRIIAKYVSVDVCGKDIRIKVYARRLHFAGRKYFVKNEEVCWFVYKNGKFYGHSLECVLDNSDGVHAEIFHEIGLDWMRDIERPLMLLASKRTILKSILGGTIYSQETLVKAIGKRLYKLKRFSWRVLRDYLIKRNACLSICNIRDFTVNVDVSLQKLTMCDEELYRLMTDMIHMAAIEDKVIDLSWSRKRLQTEHMQQIRRMHKWDIEHKDTTAIYKAEDTKAIKSGTIRLLDNELDVFLEGMNMHHCLYNCYWETIKRGSYLAFHMTMPEECTFGVVNKNEPRIDQIYLKYDKPVSKATREIAESFVSENNIFISNLLTEQSTTVENHEPIPF